MKQFNNVEMEQLIDFKMKDIENWIDNRSLHLRACPSFDGED
jgi:hypothetical protein